MAGARPRSSPSRRSTPPARADPASTSGAVEPRATRAGAGGATTSTARRADEDREQRADADHRLERDAHDVHGRPIGGRHGCRAPSTVAFGSWKASSESRSRHLDPEADVPVRVPAEQVHGRALRRLPEALERRELDRLVARDVASGPVAHDDLERRGEHCGGERDRDRDARRSAPCAPAASPRRRPPRRRTPRPCSRRGTCARARARTCGCRRAPTTGGRRRPVRRRCGSRRDGSSTR